MAASLFELEDRLDEFVTASVMVCQKAYKKYKYLLPAFIFVVFCGLLQFCADFARAQCKICFG